MSEEKKTLFCQSCGMPLTKEEEFATNKDGSRNEEYCSYCYKDGAFTSDCTMEEMVDFCIKFELEAGVYADAATARKEMLSYFPQLKRWKKVTA